MTVFILVVVGLIIWLFSWQSVLFIVSGVIIGIVIGSILTKNYIIEKFKSDHPFIYFFMEIFM
jgi:hypothetical protein